MSRSELLELFEAAERIEQGCLLMVQGIDRLLARLPDTPARTVPIAVAPVRVWAIDADAIAAYSHDELVALQRDHLADGHTPHGCETCVLIERRIGRT